MLFQGLDGRNGHYRGSAGREWSLSGDLGGGELVLGDLARGNGHRGVWREGGSYWIRTEGMAITEGVWRDVGSLGVSLKGGWARTGGSGHREWGIWREGWSFLGGLEGGLVLLPCAPGQ